MIVRNFTLHITTNWYLPTDGLYFWSARNGTTKAYEYVAVGFQIELVLQTEDTAKNKKHGARRIKKLNLRDRC